MIIPILFLIIIVLILISSGGDLSNLYTPIFSFSVRGAVISPSGADVFIYATGLVSLSSFATSATTKNTVSTIGVLIAVILISAVMPSFIDIMTINIGTAVLFISCWKIKQLGASNATTIKA